MGILLGCLVYVCYGISAFIEKIILGTASEGIKHDARSATYAVYGHIFSLVAIVPLIFVWFLNRFPAAASYGLVLFSVLTGLYFVCCKMLPVRYFKLVFLFLTALIIWSVGYWPVFVPILSPKFFPSDYLLILWRVFSGFIVVWAILCFYQALAYSDPALVVSITGVTATLIGWTAESVLKVTFVSFWQGVGILFLLTSVMIGGVSVERKSISLNRSGKYVVGRSVLSGVLYASELVLIRIFFPGDITGFAGAQLWHATGVGLGAFAVYVSSPYKREIKTAHKNLDQPKKFFSLVIAVKGGLVGVSSVVRNYAIQLVGSAKILPLLGIQFVTVILLNLLAGIFYPRLLEKRSGIAFDWESILCVVFAAFGVWFLMGR